MIMQKGICVESKGNRSIYMVKNGQFIMGNPVGPAARIGEEVHFYPQPKKMKVHWKPIWVPIIAAVAVLFLFLSVLLPAEEAFAYIQVEVNPAMEIGVDEDFDVISLRSLNADGSDLIDQLGEWKNHSLAEILVRVISMSLNDATEEVTITTVDGSKGENPELPVEKIVMAATSNLLEDNVEVHLKKATRSQWRQSVKESVPVGQKIKKFIPVHVKEQQVPAEKPKANNEENSTVKPESKIPAGQEKKETKLDSTPKNESAPNEKVKETSPKPQKKKTISGQQKNLKLSEQEKKMTPGPPKSDNILGQQKKEKTPGQEKKKIPKTKEKKETISPEKSEKKTVPKQEKENKPQQEQKNRSAQDKKAPGQMKKEKAPKAEKEKSEKFKKEDKKDDFPSKEKKASSQSKTGKEEKE
ncbi:anti-sigma-I factor RsgI family protein [Planococcus shenhongbingii]|uniref:anti-sigma-I factor RsgI family protein n=1 Tax=Planococcus shenhongbingii TaxID=3058398 RepID=UPI003F53EAB1